MTPLYRCCVCLTAAAVVLCGLGATARCVGFDLGLGDLAVLARESQRRDTLERRSKVLGERNAAKRQVVLRLIDGRLTLTQAVADFRRLNEALRNDDERADLSDEAVTENVLLWLRAEVRDSGRGADLLDGLEAEFQARFRHAPAYRHESDFSAATAE